MRLSLLLLCGLLCACSGGEDETTAEDHPVAQVQQGRQIALTNCAGCHAIDATSSSPHAEAPAFRTLSERYPVETLQEALAEGIIVGHPDMPEFRFEPDDIDALIAFMQSLQPDG